MIRRFIFLFLLSIGFNMISNAQIRDTVHITMPPYTDTTCPGTQLIFWATLIGDSAATYSWYINDNPTSVTQDSLFTTAPGDSSWVYCIIHFTNSFGLPDVDTSNWIIVRRDTLSSRAIISIVDGNNPFCTISPITFFVYPINGGRVPHYQWFVNGVPVVESDSNYYTGIFTDSSVVSCLLIADTTCYSNNDSVYSNTIMVIRDSVTASISIWSRHDTVCIGRLDTFIATVSNNIVLPVHYQWYIDTTAVTGAVGQYFYTTALQNGDSVYCILTCFDTCIRNKVQKSNVIIDSVSPILHTVATTAILHGSNPGCLDSPITFRGYWWNFGNNVTLIWYINGVQVAYDTALLDTTFLNGQVVTFKVIGNDITCRDRDTLLVKADSMIINNTPVSPVISFIGDLLVANIAGVYRWYGPGGLIPGATGQTYHPTVLGYYWAVLDTGNCPSDISNKLYVSLLKVNNLSIPTAKIYPNPSTGMLYFEWSGVHVNLSMELYNIVGQKLLHEEIINESKHQTDISLLSNGNYFVVFTDADGIKSTNKVMLQKQ